MLRTMEKKPFASLNVSIGDSDGDGKADLTATLVIGTLILKTPAFNVDILDALYVVRQAFGSARGLNK